MAMFRQWALFRRLQYISAFALVLGVVGVVVYYANFYVPPSCTDGLLNGEETGVDCGGGCVQICTADTTPPTVVWAESFEIFPGQYNTVAYIENTNTRAGVPNLNYTFQLFSNGELVAERTGVTTLPPNSTYPLFEGRVLADVTKPVTETRVILEEPPYWLPATVGGEQFTAERIEAVEFGSDPQLVVEIENNNIETASDVEVVATIFND